MKTKRNKMIKKSRSKKNKRTKTNKRWITAIDAAQATLKRTGSLTKAREKLRDQAAKNARKLFGSV
jgi:hypothetical protein